MKKLFPLLVIIFIFTFSRLISASLVTARWGENPTCSFKNVTKDCYLNQGTNGHDEYLGIRSSDDKHTLIYFDLSALPQSKKIVKAKLKLYFEVIYGVFDSVNSGYMLNIYRLTDTDNHGMWDLNKATQTQRTDNSSWTSSGDIFTAISQSPIDSIFSHPFAYGEGTANVWEEWDVTTTVQGWVNGSYPNQGFFLDGRTTLGQDAIAHSSRNSDGLTRPYLEITYEGTGTYPDQVLNLQANYKDGQTFITWDEINTDSSETKYRVYRYSSPITTDNLSSAEFIDDVPQDSRYFDRLAENNGILTTPFSNGTLKKGTGLFVYTVENSGMYYYAVTSVYQGNENRSINASNSWGPVNETVRPANPVLQYSEISDPHASANRNIYIVWLGKFDPSGRYSDYGFSTKRSEPYIFRVTNPEFWNPTDTLPLLVVFHYFSDSYAGSGFSVPMPGRFVLAADDHEPIVKANEYGHTVWFGYNINYGTKKHPRDGIVVNFTERRMDWILDWILHRNSLYLIDTNRVYMAGGSMGGIAQWSYGLRRPNIFAAGSSSVPGVNLNYDPDHRGFVLWGYEKNIIVNDSIPLRERINAGQYAINHPEIDFPIMLAYSRKGDESILWRQMPEFYHDWDSSRHASAPLYWLQGGHSEGEEPWQVFPEWQSDTSYLNWIYQFRKDQSYPVFSSFSLNGDPGNGDPNDGDLRGGINRYFEWDVNSIIDTNNRWVMIFKLNKDTPSESAYFTITPRRLQKMTHVPGREYVYWVRKYGTTPWLAYGNVIADINGLITTNILTYQMNTFYEIWILPKTSNIDIPLKTVDINLEQNSPNPANEFTNITYSIHRNSHVKLVVRDIFGRIVTTLVNEQQPAGYYNYNLTTDNLPSGIYSYSLETNETVLTKFLIVIK